MYAYPEENAQSFEGPVVGFDFEAVYRSLDPGGTEDAMAVAPVSTSPETHTDGLRRVIDWILTEDDAAGMSATRTLVSVRTMAFAWAVFPALVGGKSQSQLARNLGVSRQFFSRQVISLQETLGIRSHTMRSELARQAYREAKSRTREAESNTRKPTGVRPT